MFPSRNMRTSSEAANNIVIIIYSLFELLATTLFNTHAKAADIRVPAEFEQQDEARRLPGQRAA